MARKAVVRKTVDAKAAAKSGERLKVELRPIDTIVPYERNAKKHPDKQIAQLVDSIERFGFTIPLLISEDGTIIAGHGRYLAAKKIGMTDLPVIVARGWTDEQRRAYTIADNRLSESGEWDRDMLAIELGDLKALEFDIGVLGFSKAQVDKMFDMKAGGDNKEQLGEVKYSVVIDCDNEVDQADLLERLEGEGYKCRALML